MARNRKTAKSEGAAFEMCVADTLQDFFQDPMIRRAHKKGRYDTGDVEGLVHQDHAVVVECKNEATMKLSSWWAEVENEMGNAHTTFGVIVHKRPRFSWTLQEGKKISRDQFVTMPTTMFQALGFEFDSEPLDKKKADTTIQAISQMLKTCRCVTHTRPKFPQDPWKTMTLETFATYVQHKCVEEKPSLTFEDGIVKVGGSFSEDIIESMEKMLQTLKQKGRKTHQ